MKCDIVIHGKVTSLFCFFNCYGFVLRGALSRKGLATCQTCSLLNWQQICLEASPFSQEFLATFAFFVAQPGTQDFVNLRSYSEKVDSF